MSSAFVWEMLQPVIILMMIFFSFHEKPLFLVPQRVRVSISHCNTVLRTCSVASLSAAGQEAPGAVGHRDTDRALVAPRGTACVSGQARAQRVSLLEAAALLLTPLST